MRSEYTAEELENVAEYLGVVGDQTHLEEEEVNYSDAEALEFGRGVTRKSLEFDNYLAFNDLIVDLRFEDRFTCAPNVVCESSTAPKWVLIWRRVRNSLRSVGILSLKNVGCLSKAERCIF